MIKSRRLLLIGFVSLSLLICVALAGILIFSISRWTSSGKDPRENALNAIEMLLAAVQRHPTGSMPTNDVDFR